MAHDFMYDFRSSIVGCLRGRQEPTRLCLRHTVPLSLGKIHLVFTGAHEPAYNPLSLIVAFMFQLLLVFVTLMRS
jgi:hypothetical protein